MGKSEGIFLNSFLSLMTPLMPTGLQEKPGDLGIPVQ